jgi:cation diffusion facilitator family transporter
LQEERRIARIRNVTWIGILINVVLSVVKFVLGVLGNSQAVVADAVHSLSDLGTDFAILFGVRFWTKSPDEDHPYGHGRIEILVTAGISLVLFLVAGGIGYKALRALRADGIGQPGWIAFWGAAASIVSKELLYRWTVRVGRAVRSSAVVANAWHHRADALTSIPIALAVAVATVSAAWSFVDRIGAVIVSVFIMYTAWRIIKPVLEELLGKGVPEEQKKQIEKTARSVEGVEVVHAVRTRRMGSGIFMDLHVLVDGDMTVRKGHDISEHVKQILLERFDDVMDVTVHLEPYG